MSTNTITVPIAWLCAAALTIGGSLAGCARSAGTCSSSSDCRVGQVAGICEPTGFCSFEDATCPSGRRYSSLAGDGMAGSCVRSAGGVALPAADMGRPPVDMGGPDLAMATHLCGTGPSASACNGQYLFCDSFEWEKDGRLSDWDYDVVDGCGAELETSDDVVCRGKLALEDEADHDARAFAVKELAVPPTVYLRTALYVKPGATMPWVNLMGLASSSPSAQIALRFSDQPGKLTIARDFGSTTMATPPFGDITPGRWTCVEMRVDTSSSSGAVTVSIDGNEVARFDGLITIGNGAHGYDQVLLGIRQTTKQPAPTTWYLDEFAVSTSPIGCN